jgi:hypothetical protein
MGREFLELANRIKVFLLICLFVSRHIFFEIFSFSVFASLYGSVFVSNG